MAAGAGALTAGDDPTRLTVMVTVTGEAESVHDVVPQVPPIGCGPWVKWSVIDLSDPPRTVADQLTPVASCHSGNRVEFRRVTTSVGGTTYVSPWRLTDVVLSRTWRNTRVEFMKLADSPA